MINKIDALLQEVENLKAANAEELEALRIKYLSKKGEDFVVDERIPQCGSRPKTRSRAAPQQAERGRPKQDKRTESQFRKQPSRQRRHRPDAHGLSHRTGDTPSAFNRQERDLRHLRPLGLQHRRRAGD